MDLANKLCIVTGANSGIGKETVRAFARQKAYVIMICRNQERASTAREKIVNGYRPYRSRDYVGRFSHPT